jgi:hypothetical protein
MIDPEMAINPDIHQAIVAPPAIRLDNAVGVDLATNNGLLRGFGCIRDNLGVYAVTALEQTKDERFAADIKLLATSTLATHAFGANVGLIGFKLALKGRLSCTGLGHTHTDTLVNGVGAANRKPCQFSGICGGQIHSEQAHNLSKLGFADFRTAVVPVFPNHFKKLACVEHMFAS